MRKTKTTDTKFGSHIAPYARVRPPTWWTPIGLFRGQRHVATRDLRSVLRNGATSALQVTSRPLQL